MILGMSKVWVVYKDEAGWQVDYKDDTEERHFTRSSKSKVLRSLLTELSGIDRFYVIVKNESS